MEPKKSQGPGPAKIAVSAVLLCVVLVGVAYLLKGQGPKTTQESATLATSRLQGIFDRCAEPPTVDMVDGRTRLRCANQAHPSFMLEVTGEGDEIDTAGMMVPMRGNLDQLRENSLLGLEMFGLIAGVQAEVFIPRDVLDAVGSSETNFVFEKRLYHTKPVANVGLVFVVRPEDAIAAEVK